MGRRVARPPRTRHTHPRVPLDALDDLVKLVAQLRAPDGCPWDREQTPESMRKYLLEETHEVVEAIDIDDYSAYRSTVPNEDDVIVGPVSAACNSCHNSDLATAHMDQNGGSIMWYRWELLDEEPVETCALCHGEGGVAATDEVHGQ